MLSYALLSIEKLLPMSVCISDCKIGTNDGPDHWLRGSIVADAKTCLQNGSVLTYDVVDETKGKFISPEPINRPAFVLKKIYTDGIA